MSNSTFTNPAALKTLGFKHCLFLCDTFVPQGLITWSLAFFVDYFLHTPYLDVNINITRIKKILKKIISISIFLIEKHCQKFD